MSLAPIGCPQKASNVGCISVWRDRAFACGLASRTVRVRQHPGRAGGGFTYSEYRCFTMLAGHDLRTLSSFILTLNIVFPLHSSAVEPRLQVSQQTVGSRHVRPSRSGDSGWPFLAFCWPDMIRMDSRRLMQEHAVRCQSLAWPLFHKQAKVGIPLRGSRLAEGSIRSAWLGCKQRYRFDQTLGTLCLRARHPQAIVDQPAVHTAV